MLTSSSTYAYAESGDSTPTGAGTTQFELYVTGEGDVTIKISVYIPSVMSEADEASYRAAERTLSFTLSEMGGTAANPLALESSYAYVNAATYPSNTVYYTFTPAADGTYTVKTEEFYGEGNAYNLIAYVTVKNGDTVVAQTLKEDDTTDISVNVQLEANTAYTVIVTPYDPTTSTSAYVNIAIAQGSDESNPYYVYGDKTVALALYGGVAYVQTNSSFTIIVTSLSEGATLTIGETEYTSATLGEGVQIEGDTAFTVASETLSSVTLETVTYYEPGTVSSNPIDLSDKVPASAEDAAYENSVYLGVGAQGDVVWTYYTVAANGQYKISTTASDVAIIIDYDAVELTAEGYTFNVQDGVAFNFALALLDTRTSLADTLTPKTITFKIEYVGTAQATAVTLGGGDFV